jgi:hypothetical protein
VTTQRQSPNDALIRAARALRFALLVQGLVRWGAISAGALLALLALDNVLHLPQALRLPLAVVLAGWVVVEFYRKVLTLALRRFTPAYAARWLETHRGIGGNVLINAHHFQRDGVRAEWAPYISPLLDSSRSILSGIPPRSIWLTSQLKKWLGGLVVLLVIWTALVAIFPRYVFNGIERIFMPLADIPPIGSWSLELKPSTRVSLVEGDKLDITVRVEPQLALKSRAPVPELVWSDGAEFGTQSLSAAQHATMLPTQDPHEFNFSFSAVHQPFTFYVQEDDSRSVSVPVDVLPLPQIKSSVFHITPPAYTGLKPFDQPGPPASLEVPEGSTVTSALQLSAETPKVLWRAGTAATDRTEAMNMSAEGWQIERLVNESGAYEVLAVPPTGGDPRVLAQGEITATPDHPPEVDFVTDDRNRAVNPGGTVEVKIKATDDYGVASLALQIAASDDPSTARVIKAWKYLGPPGDKEPAPESYSISLDPSVFTPGSTFLLTAQAADFSPAGQKTTSRPIVLRVAGLADMAVPQGDVLEQLFDLLRQTIVQQTQANGQTDTLAVHVPEALAANDVGHHLEVMTQAQQQAQNIGGSALEEAGKHDEGKMYLARLEPLVRGEMDLAVGQMSQLRGAANDALPSGLAALQKRQVYILNSLIALLGQMASDRQAAAAELAKKKGDAPPPITVEQEVAKLKDDLKAFTDTQKKIIAASKAIQQLNPEDLTTAQQAVLGELAREEAKQAAFFQEKLTDLSKLPLQDFGDGKLVSDMNAVYQEVTPAAQALYQKRVEIAVPYEGAAWEKASELEQNLERWLPNTPDNTKWSMEESPQQPDIPMAELPKQLDDLIGDLLKKEQEMDPDKDDPSSTFMDSIDKGAGWGADDGPISNMSAKGVTGNQLPNNMEIGGRSGEGRNGKSDGEMVGNTAVGKGGNETPTRLTSTPFENGSVNDTSKDTRGGATGGGKLSGYGQEGLRGPQGPQVKGGGALADQQAKLRQQAESLALQLRKQRRPTGDLESAINAMQELENAARSQNGIGVTQGYQQALDSLQQARAAYAGDRLSRVEADQLTRGASPNTIDTQAEAAPAGYEEMTGAYFRSLSESAASAPPPSTAK